MYKKLVSILIMTLLIVFVISAAGISEQFVTPNDPEFNKQWALDNTGQTGGTPDADVDATEAWEIETGNSDIIQTILRFFR